MAIVDATEAIFLALLGIIANVFAGLIAGLLLVKEIVYKVLGFNKPVPHPRSILITGASSGIGAELAVQYAKPRTRLVLVARNVTRLEKVKKECEEKGATVEIASLDMSDSAAVKSYMEKVDKQVNIDLVIANAGISMTPPKEGELFSDAAQRLFDVNVFGVFHTIAPIMEGMRHRGRGQVAIMSSLSGIFSHPNLSYYGASKSALVAFSRHFRPVAAEQGIRLTCICPGFVETPLVQEMRNAGGKLPGFAVMDVKAAAKVITKGLERDRPVIIFPAIQYWPVHMTSVMPPFIQAFWNYMALKYPLAGSRQS
ncbi:hypothetical protein SpCBS45565_g04885 [Spizellomyces sp. 'palustris']|nr:hypothetical protein SpCBS45565_g04885 [Spizellomyces sp. 'palustris']